MKKLKRILIPFVCLAVLCGVCIMGINYYVILSQNQNIVTVEETAQLDDTQYILVLGCGVFGDEPSDMLEDRLLRAIEVAEKQPEAKLVLSGNNSGEDYNEVGVMKKFCLDNGIVEDRIITDDDGFSTGESVTNLENNQSPDKVIIVTQKYHLYRAMHIASQYDIEAFGVASNQRRYKMQIYYSLREVAARNKDFAKYLFVSSFGGTTNRIDSVENYEDIFKSVEELKFFIGTNNFYSIKDSNQELKTIKKVKIIPNPISEEVTNDKAYEHKIVINNEFIIYINDDFSELWLDDTQSFNINYNGDSWDKETDEGIAPSFAYSVENPEVLRDLFQQYSQHLNQ